MSTQPSAADARGDRFAAAVKAFLAFRAAARVDVDAFLREHVALHDLLEPMLRPGDGAEERDFGDYRLGRELGRGGMGVVHEAVQRSLGRRVALKLLPLGAGAAPLAAVRLQREARLVARMSHPGIVQVIEAGVHAGTAYFAMELIEGHTLTAGLRAWAEHGLPQRSGDAHALLFGGVDAAVPGFTDAIAVALDVVLQAADALEYAHGRGIVHRDVKPANLLLRADGSVFLSDFGIAGSAEPGVTITAEAAGTPWYMAPEQAAGARCDHRVDVFALGTVLFELVAGQRAFPGATAVEVVEYIRRAPTPDPRPANPAVSVDLAAVVMKAIAPRPEDRYATMAAFARDLRACRDGGDVVARPPTRGERLRRWALRDPWRATAAAIAGIGCLAGLVVVFVVTQAFVREARRTAAALVEVNRLSLGVRLDGAERTAQSFVGRGAVALEAMQAWLRLEGMPLAAQSSTLQEQLDTVRRRALPYSAADAERDRSDHPLAEELQRLERELAMHGSGVRVLDELVRGADVAALQRRREEVAALVAQRRTWTFARDEERFLHDEVARLVERLATFATAKAGAMAIVRAEIEWAQASREAWRAHGEAAWANAIAAMAADPRYRGVELGADDELLPLGADPESGLQEFLHLRSAAPDSRGGVRVSGRIPIGAGSGIVFVLVPPGEATVGGFGAAQENGHRVRFDAFLLAKHELSQGQWSRLAGENPSRMHPRALPDGRITLAHPVESIVPGRVFEVLTRHGLELPTEARWEYACRAGTTTPWSFGDRSRAGAFANFADAAAARVGVQFRCEADLDDGAVAHAPIGSYAANAWGLHDMHGNVHELCPGPSLVSGTPRDGDGRCGGLYSNRSLFVLRGGGCQSLLRECQSSTCGYVRVDAAGPLVGCRPVRALRR